VRDWLAGQPVGALIAVTDLIGQVGQAHGATSALAPRPVWAAMLRQAGWQPALQEKRRPLKADYQDPGHVPVHDDTRLGVEPARPWFEKHRNICSMS
jgi:hypothetical protein